LKTADPLKRLRIGVYVAIILALLITTFLPAFSNAQQDLVYYVYLDNTVEKGLHRFLARAFYEAAEAGAQHIIVEMNTYGGAVDAADHIGKLFLDTEIPITVFVNNNAQSAGAYIALTADHILMVPQATMGSATVVDLEGQAGDAKTMAMWIEKMKAAAESNGRDPLYAEAMVDPDIEIEGLVGKGMPLNFNASEAVEHGYAEGIVSSLAEALAFLELEGAQVVEVEITFAESVARFITNPIVASILLSLASLGLILELYSPGFGVPGAIGLAALLLFFFGHMIAGFAGWEALILLIIGIGLLALEVFTAGFGLFGLLGIASVVGSLLLASVDIAAGIRHIGVALIVSIVALLILSRFLNRRGFFSKLVLEEELSTAEGTTRHQQKSEWIGKEGVAINKLRPSGTIKLDGRLVDVVSDGRPIPAGARVRVVHVEGTRVMVTQVDEEEW
jgi:membrane-bound serine protease (ClpP class)